MSTPSDKDPALDAEITRLTGIDRRAAIRSNICPFCKKPALVFRDELSRKEHTISGLCQNCQDEMFK